MVRERILNRVPEGDCSRPGRIEWNRSRNRLLEKQSHLMGFKALMACKENSK